MNKKIPAILLFGILLCASLPIFIHYTNTVVAISTPHIHTWGQKIIATPAGTGKTYVGLPDIVRAENGNLIAAYYAGNGHLDDNSKVCYKISSDNGSTWGAVQTLYDHSSYDTRDPQFVLCPNGDIVCFINQYYGVDSGNEVRDATIHRSTDNGLTWSLQETATWEPQRYFQAPFTYGNSVYVSTYANSYHIGGAQGDTAFYISTDNCTNFIKLGVVDVTNRVSENSVIRLDNGTFLLMFRDVGNGNGLLRMSTDGGYNWFNVSNALSASDLADPNLDWLDNHTMILTDECNAACAGSSGSYFYISNDNATSWTNITLLKAQTSGDDYDGFTTLPQRTGAPEGYEYGGYGLIIFANNQQIYTRYIANNQTYKIQEEDETIHFTSFNGGGNETFFHTGTPEIKWTLEDNAVSYHLQASTNNIFSNVVIDIYDINEYVFPFHYSENSTYATFILPSEYRIASVNSYYWRVIPYK